MSTLNQIISIASIFVLSWTLNSCGKISENKLLGKTYEVQDVARYDGTNLATWRNTHKDEEFGEGDYAFNIVSSSGQFDFSDDGDVDISVELSWDGGDGNIYNGAHVNQGGKLVSFDDRQDWFDVEGGTYGYTQYFIEEKNGKELIIAWEQLYGQYGTVYLFKVKR